MDEAAAFVVEFGFDLAARHIQSSVGRERCGTHVAEIVVDLEAQFGREAEERHVRYWRLDQGVDGRLREEGRRVRSKIPR